MEGSNNNVLVSFLVIAVIGFSLLFGSCGSRSGKDDVARHAIDQASVVRMVDDIANGGK